MLDSERIIDYLTRKCPNARCPMCSRPFFKAGGKLPDEGLDVGSHRLALIQITGDDYNITLGRKIETMSALAIEIICHDCGYMMLFRADRILGT